MNERRKRKKEGRRKTRKCSDGIIILKALRPCMGGRWKIIVRPDISSHLKKQASWRLYGMDSMKKSGVL